MPAAQKRPRGRPEEFSWSEGLTLANVVALMGSERALAKYSPRALTTIRRWKKQEPAFGLLLNAARNAAEADRIRREVPDAPRALADVAARAWATLWGAFQIVREGHEEAIPQWLRERGYE